RRARGRLRAVAASARSARPVPRVADGQFSRPLPPRVQAHPRDPRWQGLRLELGQAHDRRRAGRLDDRPPLRTRLREARLQQDANAADARPFQSAAAGRRAIALILAVFFPRPSQRATSRRLTWAVDLDAAARTIAP